MILHRAMFELLSRTLRALLSTLASRASREVEIFVLRQQLLVLSRKSRARDRLRNLDRLVLVWLYRLFPSLLDAIIVVKPETLLCWDRGGFRAYWRWKWWRRGGRPKIDLRTPGLNPAHEPGKSVGRIAHPRRIADAWDRCQ